MFNYIIVKKKSFIKDILAGVTVSLVLVPSGISFALITKVDPLIGLYTSGFVAVITSLLGGRPGMISGSASALAVVSVSLVKEYGTEYLFAAVILMGILQLAAGVCRLGKFMRLIPHSVMLGFINGLAIVIFLSQLSHFQVSNDLGAMQWMRGGQLGIMLLLVAISMLIIHFFPKLTKSLPSSLVAIITVSFLVYLFNIPTTLLKDIAFLKGGLPTFQIPEISYSFTTIKTLFTYAITLSIIGMLQSHMTMQFIDELTETRGYGDKEFIGQGIANIFTGFLSCMGGSGTIPYSVVNINSGGRGRSSGVIAGIFLLFYVSFGYFLIEKIPVAALVGVMFMVVLSTFEWSSFRLLGKIPKMDAFVIILVSLTTVFTDLAIAVFFGVVVSALVFAWDKSKRIHIHTYIDSEGIKHYQLVGPLFFASAKTFQGNFDWVHDPATVMIDFSQSRVCDHSGIEVLNSLMEKYAAANKTVLFKNLSPDCEGAIHKAGIKQPGRS